MSEERYESYLERTDFATFVRKQEKELEALKLKNKMNNMSFTDWNVSVSKDEMTGKESAYAHSRETTSTKPMTFPYGGTTAWLGVGCNGQKEWSYLGFSQAPNLIDAITEDGYYAITSRVKWDNQVEKAKFSQNWGESYINFNNDKAAILHILKSNTLLLELNWHGNSPTYFKFSLNGSSAAIAEMRKQCRTR